jgi:hypothetical protein
MIWMTGGDPHYLYAVGVVLFLGGCLGLLGLGIKSEIRWMIIVLAFILILAGACWGMVLLDKMSLRL